MSPIPHDAEWYRTEYLKSAHWRWLRALRLEFAHHRCEQCGWSHDADSLKAGLQRQRGPLDVHHLVYRELYDVTLADLRVLCRRCHDRKHEWLEWRRLFQRQEDRRCARKLARLLEKKRDARRETRRG